MRFSEVTSKYFEQKWNQELADYAELNVRSCQYGHDCHNSDEFKSSGQNIAQQGNIGGGVTYMEVPEFIEQSLVRQWWAEKDMTSQSDLDNCCGPSDKIFHFTMMAADRNTEVGCAISHYLSPSPKGDAKTSYIVCNYSFNNLQDQPVYVKGPTASQCKTGNNPNYPALCSNNEQVNPNKFF